ncbi:hypothetical protein FPRO04_04478 [Fusarium proliferatum]|nr:hypothetical protein FPRO03_02677 [Fusarium proliferatum]KAG4268062.1 hypothetical protein FPRO04_04478 [Fusarium proliferatum]CVL06507.1 uncharacterized protein FPRN_05207 [Fusarium proliferatum]
MSQTSRAQEEASSIELGRKTRQPVILCRFLSGMVVKEEIDLHEIPYIAFSHVWGDADWTTLNIITDQVMVSKSKARFLEHNLQDLVGDSYFWMDVLCIDQTKEEERIKVTSIIPQIFEHAQKTIVIRDGSGYISCCARAFGSLSTWDDYNAGVRRWCKHWTDEHNYHLLKEGILERLWPLQESILSNRIQFVTCEEGHLASNNMDWGRILSGQSDILANVDRLWTFSRAWASHGKDKTPSGDEQLSFISAFLNNKEVSRDFPGGLSLSGAIEDGFFIQSNSTRRTTKARDLILSTMSQYDWYSAPSPQVVRGMGFGRLFQDCFSQARHADRATLPKITAGMVGEQGTLLETSNVPEPELLGDLVKLFGLATEGALQHDTDCALGAELGPVVVRSIESCDMSTILRILEGSLEFSKNTWELARKGELSLHGAWPDLKAIFAAEDEREDDEDTSSKNENLRHQNAIRFLNLMVLGFFDEGGTKMDADSFKRDLISSSPSKFSKTLVRLGALISCGIGISAYMWSKTVWTPVLVTLGKTDLLGVISSRELANNSLRDEYHLRLAHPISSDMTITYKHAVITRPGEGLKAQHRCIGLLPAFTDMNMDREGWSKRYEDLGFPEVPTFKVVDLI